MNIDCVVDSRSKTGEGAVWDVGEQRLYWVDIPAGLIHRFDPSTGRNETRQIDEDAACLALRERGGLVIATRSGFHLFDFETGRKDAITDPEANRPESRFNDGTTDARGRFWAGTMKDRGEPVAAGRFYRLDPDHSCFAWRDNIWTTNGLAFSPDGRTMYFSDSNPAVRTIWACDYDLDDGMPHNERVFFDTRDVAGRPDGGTVDADGCYWMAGVSGWQIVRITPAGKVDRIIEMPVERPSKPMFGGAGLDTLYVTSIGNGLSEGSEERQPQAGGLFAISGLGVQGLPQTRFAG
ncbi:MAG: SMP-30/gluconolactonase/LRE family protein [Geminicoccaceae bacterium]|nr:SMP-30/gluconolactonase/LRE family protein [Geminicoccaceae bacterium]